MHRSTRYNAYAFEVNRLANKDDVRRAVEELFNVKVLHVHTQNRKGKPRRSRFSSGHTKDWKKAIVTLDRNTASISSDRERHRGVAGPQPAAVTPDRTRKES